VKVFGKDGRNKELLGTAGKCEQYQNGGWRVFIEEVAGWDRSDDMDWVWVDDSQYSGES
jgi:hypothetical protein